MSNSNLSWNRQTGIAVDPQMSVDDMVKAAGLDWTVELSEHRYGHFQEHSSGRFDAYRSTDGMYIDQYTSRKTVQNRDMVTMFDSILKSLGMSISTLGSINEGKRLYASVDLPADMDIKPGVGDITKAKLMLLDSHLNGEGLQIMLYLDRLICTNGMTTKLSQKVGVIQHNGKIDTSVIRPVINEAIRMIQFKRHSADLLVQKQMAVDEATVQLIAAFGDPSKEVYDQPEVVKSSLRLFQGQAMGSDLQTSFNTAWGLLQAVTQYYNWESKAQSEANRFSSLLIGEQGKKQNKFERQLVGCSV